MGYEFNGINFDTDKRVPEITPIYLPSVLPCGTHVETKLSNIHGMITCVSERFGQYKYEISYFLQGKQEVIWMDALEFDVIPWEKSTIGFNKH